MIKTQKTIKYVATAFAILLAVNIISMIMYGIISIGTIFTSNNDDDYIYEELKTLKVSDNNNALVLDIDIASSNVIIKEGSKLEIETNNKYINLSQENNKITINEKKHSWINQNNESALIISIPTNHIFDDISIENGAGKIEIETLNTKKLELDLGAGKVDIKNLNITNNLEIDGGAGEITITDGNINNLDLDMGVGKVSISAILTGNNKIDAGVGALDLNINDSLDNYKIVLDKGLGDAILNGEKMQNSTYYGSGSNLIDIDGGVGTIKINFINN